MLKVHGLYTAIITPFTNDGKLDEKGLKQNLHFQMENGVNGIAALGTTGESPTLSNVEKKRILDICKEECKGKIAIMAGTGSYSTETTIANTKEARDHGVDCALVITPYYNRPMQEGLFRHFKAVAEAVPDLPIMIYNHQGRTGQNLSTQTLIKLSQIPNIIGVKEASGSMIQIMEVIELICKMSPNFTVMCGEDALTFPAMASGAHGVISVASNLIPREMRALVNALITEDYQVARSLHYRFMPLFRTLNSETNPGPIKEAMLFKGLPSGECRLPLCNLSDDNRTNLEKTLSELDF